MFLLLNIIFFLLCVEFLWTQRPWKKCRSHLSSVSSQVKRREVTGVAHAEVHQIHQVGRHMNNWVNGEKGERKMGDGGATEMKHWLLIDVSDAHTLYSFRRLFVCSAQSQQNTPLTHWHTHFSVITGKPHSRSTADGIGGEGGGCNHESQGSFFSFFPSLTSFPTPTVSSL